MTTYFAFVRRAADRRYSAQFPDLGGLTVHARGIRQLPGAAIMGARRIGLGRAGPPPVATDFRDLPRLADEADGYWLAVDLADAMPSPDADLGDALAQEPAEA